MTRLLAAAVALTVVAAPRCAGSVAAGRRSRAPGRRARRSRAAGTDLDAAERQGLGQVPRHRRHRHRRPLAVRGRPAQIAEAHKQFPVRVRDHARRQPVRQRERRATTSTSSRGRTSRCSTPACKFYASLGNHDEPSQRFYKPFNMDGKRYYTFRKGDVELLRARQHLHDAGAGRLAEERARGVGREVEDPVLPPSDLLVRRTARLRASTCRCWSSRCSCRTASTWSSPATSTSTSG